MLEDEYGTSMRDGKLDNAGTDLVGDMCINVSDLSPEVGIVLFVLGDDAEARDRLAAMRPSSCAPLARYRCAISDEGSRKAGAAGGLNAAHS